MAGGRPKVGRILVSINPFVPKPWTPFQWEPMEDLGSLKRKLARVRRQLSAIPAVQVETESPREGYLQTLLSRGDRRVAELLERLHADPEAWWPTLRALRGGRHDIVDPDRFVHRAYGHRRAAAVGLHRSRASTSATSSPSAARRTASSRRRPATRTPATPAARADGGRDTVIAGIGVDVCEVDRIRRALDASHGDALPDRVFTDAEQAYCEGRRRGRFESYAARFAAKEAAMKVLGTGWSQRRRRGATSRSCASAGRPPALRLHGQAASLARRLGMARWLVSLTHSATSAIAWVVAERGRVSGRARPRAARRDAAAAGGAGPRPRARR